jgi:hypothetical protein
MACNASAIFGRRGLSQRARLTAFWHLRRCASSAATTGVRLSTASWRLGATPRHGVVEAGAGAGIYLVVGQFGFARPGLNKRTNAPTAITTTAAINTPRLQTCCSYGITTIERLSARNTLEEKRAHRSRRLGSALRRVIHGTRMANAAETSKQAFQNVTDAFNLRVRRFPQSTRCDPQCPLPARASRAASNAHGRRCNT